MIPSSDLFDQSTLTALLEHDPLVQAYRAFFALLDFSLVDDWPTGCATRYTSQAKWHKTRSALQPWVLH